MPHFRTYDGLELAYDVRGKGETLVVLPGGPLRPPAYLGDLGGVGTGRRVVVLHLRGTGDSPQPEDPESFRCDRMVGDVEALRAHLELDRLDVLGHSAGANLAALYAAAHPHRIRRLALVTPSLRAVGLAPTPEERDEAQLTRRDEPWFAEALAADESYETPEEQVLAEAFSYGRWDDAARAHVLADLGWGDEDAVTVHHAPEVFTPEATRAALSKLEADVLVLAGELDTGSAPAWVRRLAEVFPPESVRFEVQAGAGHYPWIDGAAAFRAVVEGWLAGS
jgi:pimeloyl-ACP methyl ester carboxylesterase